MPEKAIYSICGMCSAHCPVQVNVENGQCRFIQGNLHASGIGGALCARGAAGLSLIKDDERPQFPMMRKAGRGQGLWQRLTWDQALDRVAEKLMDIQARYGKQSLIASEGGRDCFSDLTRAFVRGLGTPNYHSDDDNINGHHAALSLFGFGAQELVADYRRAKYVVLQGRNVFESIDVKEVNDLLDGLEGGCKLAVIDIRETISSAKADRFLRIRPGTDAALNLSVIHVLLQGLYDEGFAREWVSDIEALRTFAAPYTPQWAQAETGIPAGSITELVESLAKAAPAVIWHPGRKSCRYKDSFYVSRTAYIINALLGAIGHKGGLALSATPESLGRKGLKQLTELVPAVAGPRADGVGDRYPVFDPQKGLLHRAFQAVETGEPYPVRAYMVFGHDPLAEYPDPDAVKRQLESLELLVCLTPFWSQSAWHADIVLPVSAYLEQESILFQRNGLKPGFGVRFRCVNPRLDSRSQWRIITGLSRRLGIGALAFDGIEDIWGYQLQETGVSMADFEQTGQVELTAKPVYEKLSSRRLKTDSAKIEIVNSRWEKAGIASLAPYAAVPAPPPGKYRLTIGGCAVHAKGHTINNPRLFAQMPENVLWLHEAAARDLGVCEGDSVEVCAKGYSAVIRAHISNCLHPQAVFMVPGFGRSIPAESRACGRGVSDIQLMGGGLDRHDPAGGGLALQEHFVSVKKA